MIGKGVWKFCNGDVSKIENYDNAIADRFVSWHCHHRREILPDGSFITKDELKRKNLYFNRPPEELIFLRPKDHLRLHTGCLFGRHKSFQYSKAVVSFADFLNKKKEIQQRYNVWITRHPENEEELVKERNKIICDLLDEFEKKEKNRLKTLDKAKEFSTKFNQKLLCKQ